MRVVEQIQRMQGNELTVLITGESGTGKELVARAIHVGSMRSSAVFLPYNCTTTSRDLADSQLFGHRRGSFTGAVNDQLGLVRTAAGGTLFLDEIGDLPLDVQPKLLRFLEQGEIMPVGETRPLRVDVRVLAATNVDLEQRVADGKFREDLYYRLTVIRIVDSAAARPARGDPASDEPVPARSVRAAGQTRRVPHAGDPRAACAVLVAGQRPAAAQRDSGRRRAQPSGPWHRARAPLTGDHVRRLPPADERRSPVRASPRSPVTSLADAVDGLEREIIEATLHQSSGNISEAARTLGLTRRGLYLKLRRLGLETAPIADTK